MSGDEPEVRAAVSTDARFAQAASKLIGDASEEHDIACRTPRWLEDKIRGGKAVIALLNDELIGFAYWTDWEGGRWISHSGLVVRADLRGRGLGRRLKTVLMEASRARLPEARVFSLTNSPVAKAVNLSLGFRVVPLDQLTKDPAFWAGCRSCRKFEEVQARGALCCCEGMLLPLDA